MALVEKWEIKNGKWVRVRITSSEKNAWKIEQEKANKAAEERRKQKSTTSASPSSAS